MSGAVKTSNRHGAAGAPAELARRLAAVLRPKRADGTRVPAAIGRQRLVLFVTVVLALFGLVMVTSATSGSALLQGESQWSYLQKQVKILILGAAAMWLAMRVPMATVRRLTRPMLVGSVILLFAVFAIGVEANGAKRWIYLGGGFYLQPSELVKIGVVLYIADYLAWAPAPRHWLRDFIKSPGGIGIALTGVVFIQRDLGSAMVVGSVVVVMYMLSGTNWRLLAGTIGPGIALVALGIVSEEYRRERFIAFLDPWASPHGEGYQLVQALVAIGSGGPFGVGLGHSVQKIHFLPEAHTDMIFSIIAEELGLVGVVVVLAAFGTLAIVGARIALRARNRYESLVAAGLTFVLCGQAVLNLAGVVGLLPLTGVPLPLVSYGGSNLLVSLTALGLLANIALPRREQRAALAAAGRDTDGADDDDENPQPPHDPRARRTRGARGDGRHGGAPRSRTGGRHAPA